MKIKVLWNFVKYCLTHPNERFWQALVNWSGYNFIFGSYKFNLDEALNDEELEDVFYRVARR